MERFIHNENIRRYPKLLKEETDEEKRNISRKLLAEEEAREIPPKPNRNDDKPKRPQLPKSWATSVGDLFRLEVRSCRLLAQMRSADRR
jgi:hypothetical protein